MFLDREQFEAEVGRWENRLVANCKLCNGVGAIPSENKGLYKTCICKQKAWLNSNLVDWGIPRKYLDESWSWENCHPQDFVKKSKDYATRFIDHYFNGKGVFLYGSQGRGKSTMEALIARDIAKKINPDTKKHFKVAFAIYEDIVQMSHQARVNPAIKQKLDTLINSPELLIIDNIGSETGLGSDTKYTTRLLEFILRKRDNNGTPTIISSNFTPEELTKHYSDTVHDFVENNCELILVTGDNFRRKSNVSDLINEFGMGADGDDW